MVDLKVSNVELRARGHRLIRTVVGNPDLTDEHLNELLAKCGDSVKLAIVVEKSGLMVEEARTHLDKGGGGLESVLRGLEHRIWQTKSTALISDKRLHLCVDGGGTGTRAVISTFDDSGRR